MLNLKKTAVAVLALGSSAVFAGTMGPVCAPGSVTVPCASTAWEFGVQALYLKPSVSGHAFRSVTLSDPLASPTVGGGTVTPFTAQNYNTGPDNWAWGFKLEGAYHFSTGNDLNLNWYHLNNTVSDTGSFITAATLPTGLATSVSYAAATVTTDTKPNWDAVNLEFGQHAHFGEWKNIRFHGGLQYAYINNKYALTRSMAAGVDSVTGAATEAFNTSSEASLKYSGVGPRVGADYWYNWGNGFAMYANAASALLVGRQSFDNQFQYLLPAVAAGASPVFTSNGSATTIVPELEAKLGLTYGYAMAQGDLSLDVGWMWVNYFNALNRPNYTGSVTSAPSTVTTESDFGVQGPFIGLKWVGNVV